MQFRMQKYRFKYRSKFRSKSFVSPIRRAGNPSMELRNFDPVIYHDLVRAIGIQPDVRHRNIIGVSYVEVFVDLKFEKSDH